MDASGHLFIADSSVGAVFEVVPVNGKLTTSSPVNVIGSGFTSPTGVAVDAKGDVFVADSGSNAVYEIVAVSGNVSSSSTVIQVGSGFNGPSAVAVDSQTDVFVADTGNNAVKEIVAVSGVVSSTSTVNTLGSGFASPAGVAVDSANNVIIADTGNNAVKEYWPSYQKVFTVATGFNQPAGVAVDPGGDVYVADNDNAEVKEILLQAGVGIGTNPTILMIGSGFASPVSVAVDRWGDVFVGDIDNYAVDEVAPGAADFGTVKVGSTGETILLPFTFDSATTLTSWKGLTEGAAGLDFAVSTSGTTCTVRRYGVGDSCMVAVDFGPTSSGLRIGAVQLMASGSVIATAHMQGIGSAPEVVFPSNPAVTLTSLKIGPFGNVITADAAGDLFFASQDTVHEFVAVNGRVTAASPVRTIATLSGGIYALTVDGAGDVFAATADAENGTIQEIEAVDGKVSSTSPIRLVTVYESDPAITGLAVDAAGNLYFSQGTTVDAMEAVDGQVSEMSLIIPLGSAKGFTGASGLAFDAAGDLFVADYGDVKEIVASHGHLSSGSQVVSVGSGFNAVAGVAVDAAGDVFVGEGDVSSADAAVKEIVAVNGVVTSASRVVTISTPRNPAVNTSALAMDAGGNLFVGYRNLCANSSCTSSKGSITEIPLSVAPTLSFSPTSSGDDTSLAQTVTVQNIGNAPLSFPIPSSGNNPGISANFSLDSSGAGACPLVGSGAESPGTLAAGKICYLPISFTPGSATYGNTSGLLALTDNTLNAAAPGYATQTMALSGVANPPVGTINKAVDAATGSTTVGQGNSLLVTGWAADPHDGAPVSRVAVLIDGTAVGNATLGIARPDIVSVYNNFSYYNSGWTFTWPAAGLSVGNHTVSAVVYDSLGLSTAIPDRPLNFTVSTAPVAGPPAGALNEAVDATTRSTTVATSDNLLVGGWAADPTQGAPVSSVAIFVDGKAAGAATLGIARPDVASAQNNPAWLNSGWSFTESAGGLAIGTHKVTAVATDSLGNTATFGPATITVSTVQTPGPPFGSLDKAVDATSGSSTVSQSDNLLVSGWAADFHDGAPVHQVSILIDGVAVGNATLGRARPDVAATEKNARYLDSGWTFTTAASGLSVGTHTVTAVATDSLGMSTQLPIALITVTN